MLPPRWTAAGREDLLACAATSGAVVKQTTGFRSAAEPASTIAAADREVNVPPAKGNPFACLPKNGLGGGERTFCGKGSPPLFKNSYQER